jgi:hypothetical protein
MEHGAVLPGRGCVRAAQQRSAGLRVGQVSAPGASFSVLHAWSRTHGLESALFYN